MGSRAQTLRRDEGHPAEQEGHESRRGPLSQSLGRFLEEAQITGQLDHPGVVAVHEVGTTDDGFVYFTMSYVDGKTLEEIIDLVPSREIPNGRELAS